jgi:hypothetical protein
MFLDQVQPDPYNFGTPDDQEWFIDEIIGHQWATPKRLELHVQWSLGDTTWELLEHWQPRGFG